LCDFTVFILRFSTYKGTERTNQERGQRIKPSFIIMDYIDLIGPVIVAVKLTIDQYQAICVLKKETKEYRNTLHGVLDLLTELKAQQKGRNNLPTSLARSLDLIRDAVQEGMEVFELCSNPMKRMEAFVMSKTYLNKLNASASKIHEALVLLSGAGVALPGAIQDNILETREMIEFFQSKVMRDTTRITNELGSLQVDLGNPPEEPHCAGKRRFRRTAPTVLAK
jgi:hypothetical protein